MITSCPSPGANSTSSPTRPLACLPSVVGDLDLVVEHREPSALVNLMVREALARCELRDAGRIDQASGDRDVADPQLLQVQRRGWPCTPMLATRPPRRTSSAASSKVSGTRRSPARLPPRT